MSEPINEVEVKLSVPGRPDVSLTVTEQRWSRLGLCAAAAFCVIVAFNVYDGDRGEAILAGGLAVVSFLASLPSLRAKVTKAKDPRP